MQKKRDELKDLRQFGIALAAILVVFGLIKYLKHGVMSAVWLCGAGAIILSLGLFAPRMLKGAYSIFLKVAHAIGWFNTRAILVLIYFLLVTPIAVIIRILGKDPLNRKICKDESSYWIKRSSVKTVKEQLEKQF